MMEAVRNGAWAKAGGGWTNPYVADGLVAMWDGKANPPNDVIWPDVSGNGYDMQLIGKYLLGTNYVELDGINHIYGVVNDFNLSIPTTQEFAVNIESAIAYSDYIGNGNGAITGQSEPIGWYYGFGRDMSFNKAGSYGVDFQFSVTSKDGLVNLYTYGIVRGNGYQASLPRSNYSNPIYIFRRNGTLNYGIKGRIYCIRIYDRILSSQEIAANYAIDKARFNLP